MPGGVPLPQLDAAFGILADRAELARAASVGEGHRWAESFRQPVTRTDLRAALVEISSDFPEGASHQIKRAVSEKR
jgi:hypothetical protein